MPAILSHHILGRSVLAKLESDSYNSRDERDAFLLGNQGPDPLFYSTFSTQLVNIKTLGSRMHGEQVEQVLETWRNMLSSFRPGERRILEAYISGFLCHFALDRAAHPLIFAYQNAITAAGVPGLNADSGSFVHGQIEADLDVYLLYKLTGRTIGEYVIPKQVLYSSDEALALIDKLYVAAAKIYKLDVPGNAFSLSVRDMRLVVKISYSPGGTRRNILGRLERLVRPHSLLQAMSHRSEAYIACWYANESHQDWIHPGTGATNNAAYLDLFNQAVDTAVSDIVIFEIGVPISRISQGVDFSGNPTKV
jgi:hypothetical protein